MGTQLVRMAQARRRTSGRATGRSLVFSVYSSCRGFCIGKPLQVDRKPQRFGSQLFLGAPASAAREQYLRPCCRSEAKHRLSQLPREDIRSRQLRRTSHLCDVELCMKAIWSIDMSPCEPERCRCWFIPYCCKHCCRSRR